MPKLVVGRLGGDIKTNPTDDVGNGLWGIGLGETSVRNHSSTPRRNPSKQSLAKHNYTKATSDTMIPEPSKGHGWVM